MQRHRPKIATLKVELRSRILVPLLAVVCFTLTGCGVVGLGSQNPAPAQPVYHTVRSGENLHQIGKTYGVEPDRLAILNGIRNPRAIPVGTRLLVRYETRRGSGVSKSNEPRVERATYAPPRKGTPPKAAYTDGIILWPVATGNIVSKFGPRSSSFHDGLDIAAPSGTPIYAAHSGVVLYSDNELGGYGNLVILRDKSGMTSIYGHCRRRLVSEGEQVKRGQVIAEVGSTGHSSGPHLHFEVRTKDSRGRYVAVDPLPLFTQSKPKPNYRVNESLTPILAKLLPF
jgi:murein DD-endopeptidase MepM/ murein hydrolase activator NlpD